MTHKNNGIEYKVFLNTKYELDFSEVIMFGSLIESGELKVYSVASRSDYGYPSYIDGIIGASPLQALMDFLWQMGVKITEPREIGL